MYALYIISYVQSEYATEGTEVALSVRGKMNLAQVRDISLIKYYERIRNI